MRRRGTSGSGNGGRKDYTVGYGKPPIHSRFQPGQSGNPAGRRKGLRNLRTDVKEMLATPVKVNEAGRTRTRSTQEALLMLLREKGFKGDVRALAQVLELALRFNNDPAEAEQTQPMPAEDRAILDAFVTDCVGDKTNLAAGDADADSNVESRRCRNKKAPT